MLTVYVQKKSELTTQMNRYHEQGYKVYRTRTECACTRENRRNAVLCVNQTTMVLDVSVIKCKGCFKL